MSQVTGGSRGSLCWQQPFAAILGMGVAFRSLHPLRSLKPSLRHNEQLPLGSRCNCSKENSDTRTFDLPSRQCLVFVDHRGISWNRERVV
jgi:hypothetical protein